MKNFFKKLSFVMAAAMVVTSLYAPANAEAASKNFVRVKKSSKAVTSKEVFVGGRKVNFDYTIGKKTKGVAGTWTSSNKSVAVVDKKTGVVKAVGNGKAVITFKTKKTKKMKKVVTVKTTVYGRTRAESVSLMPTDESIKVKVGKTAEFTAKLNLSEKIKAAGGKESTYMVYAESDSTAAAVKVDGMKVTVEGKEAYATPATIKVFASHAKTAEKAKTQKYNAKAVEVKVQVVANLEAKQGSINTIKVMGSDLSTNPAMYVVKNERGTVLTLKKGDVMVNADKTEATLVADMPRILKGKYTLTYNKDAMVDFEVVDVEVKAIKFMPEDKAIITNSNNQEVTVGYKVFDQFDNDITDTTIPDLNIVASIANPNTATKGKVKLTYTTAPYFRPNVDKVSVTIVNKTNGVHASGIFTVSEMAKVWEVEYKGLANKEKKMVETFSEKLDKPAYLLFMLKDQYGNEFTDADLAKAQLSVSLPSATGLMLKNPVAVTKETIGGKDYIAYELDYTTLKEGEVTVNAICLNNGKMSTGKFNVTHSVKVDRFSVNEGVNGIYNGQANDLDFEALDMDGKPVTDIEVLKAFESKIQSSVGGTFKFNKDEKTGKITLSYTPAYAEGAVAGSTGTVSAVISGVTPTFKFFNKQVNIRMKRVPSEFLGLKSDTVTGATNNKVLEIGHDKLRFQDQYGAEMSAADIADLYPTGDTYKLDLNVVNTDNLFTLGASVLGTAADQPTVPQDADPAEYGITKENLKKPLLKVKATDNKDTASIKVEVNFKGAKANGEKRDIEISNIKLADLEKFEIGTPALQPAFDLYSEVGGQHKFLPEVFGYYKGTKLKLEKDQFSVFAGLAEDGQTDGEVYVKVPKKASIPANEMTAKATFKVIILNGKATEVSSEYTYSKEAPKVAKAELDNAKVEAATDTTMLGWQKLAPGFTVKDQYGETMNGQPYITFTFTKEALTTADAKVVNNGAQAAGVVFNTGAKTLKGKIKLAWAGTTYVFEGDIELKRN